MANSFFQRGYSSSPLGKLLMKSFGWANAGIDALNLANSAFGATNRTGNALSTLGGVVGSIPTPYTQIIGAGLGAAGALVNGFTDKVNEAHKNAVNSQINNLALTNSNASDYQGLQLDYKTLMNNHIELGDLKDWGDIGIFSNGKKVRRAREDARQGLLVALQTALNNLNARGLEINQMNFANLFLNLMAFGGPMMDFGNGAIGYSFMNRYIQSKENPEFNDKITSMPNSFTPMPELSTFAYGGNMGAYGADWTNGLTHINNGGTHEQNPFEGVQMGVDQEGTPNLVEEGEVVWNDYVFSNRLKVPNRFKEANKLKDSIVTFADAAREFSKESEERPNDPISKRGLDAAMSNLASQLEKLRIIKRNGRRFDDGGFRNSHWPDTNTGLNVLWQYPSILNYLDFFENPYEYAPLDLYGLSEYPEIVALDSYPPNTNSEEGTNVKREVKSKQPTMLDIFGDLTDVGKEYNIDINKIQRQYQLSWEYRNANKDFQYADPGIIVKSSQSEGKRQREAEEKAQLLTLQNLVGLVDYLNKYNAVATVPKGKEPVGTLTLEDIAPSAYTTYSTKAATPTTTKSAVASTATTPTTATTTTTTSATPYRSTTAAKSSDTTSATPATSASTRTTRTRAASAATPSTTVTSNPTSAPSLPELQVYQKPEIPTDIASIIDYANKNLFYLQKDPSKVLFFSAPTIDTEQLLSRVNASLSKPQSNGTIQGITSGAIAGRQSDNPLNSWLRYTPVIGSALGLMLNLASRPDYSNANMIQSAAERAGQIGLVGYNPIGNYLSYNPLDIAYQSNLINALSAATRRAIQQLANGNIGATMSGLLATDFNNLNALGEAYREATKLNLALRQAVEQFNRATNLTNSDMGLKAAMANQQADMLGNNAYMSGIAQAAQMRQTADLSRSQGISANYTGLFLGLGDIGRGNVMWDMIEKNPYLLYTPLGGYKGAANAANGGYLTIKRKKKGGRR